MYIYTCIYIYTYIINYIIIHLLQLMILMCLWESSLTPSFVVVFHRPRFRLLVAVIYPETDSQSPFVGL